MMSRRDLSRQLLELAGDRWILEDLDDAHIVRPTTWRHETFAPNIVITQATGEPELQTVSSALSWAGSAQTIAPILLHQVIIGAETGLAITQETVCVESAADEYLVVTGSASGPDVLDVADVMARWREKIVRGSHDR